MMPGITDAGLPKTILYILCIHEVIPVNYEAAEAPHRLDRGLRPLADSPSRGE